MSNKPCSDSKQPCDLGSRLELMVDDYLVERLDGRMQICLRYGFNRR